MCARKPNRPGKFLKDAVSLLFAGGEKRGSVFTRAPGARRRRWQRLWRRRGGNSRALPYHAGLPPRCARPIRRSFLRDEVAGDLCPRRSPFGMGINKPDVRYIRLPRRDLPKNI